MFDFSDDYFTEFEGPALRALFMAEYCSDALSHLLMLVRPSMFGIIAQINRQCATVASKVAEIKLKMYLIPDTENVDPNGEHVNYIMSHNGRYHGPVKLWWRQSGVDLKKCCTYHYGKLQGEEIRLSDGVRLRCSYVNDKLHGEYVQWHSNGRISHQVFYKNGNKDGVEFKWYESGNIKKIVEYKDGAMYGRFREWDENGNLVVLKDYRDNKTHGETYEWHPMTRDLRFFVETKKGLYHGHGYSWTSTGDMTVRHYLNGQPHGARTHWCDGVVIERSNYKQGMLHGVYHTWYQTGRLEVRCYYRCNYKHGPFVHYYPNGKKFIESHYRRNSLHGRYKEWNEAGQLIKYYVYVEGKEVRGAEWDNDGNIIRLIR